MTSKFINDDCMNVMKEYPDKFFDLAIVDPPYGGGRHKTNNTGKRNGKWFSNYDEKIDLWDKVPSQEYFNELFRVSKNQIIWGGNYFVLPPSRGFIIWKKKSISENFSMAMCEYAWMSFDKSAKCFEYKPQGDKNDPRFHPTQKPIALYEWILKMYAKEGDLILDTHVGSASSLIACENMGFNYVGCEIDKDYYDKACERILKFRNMSKQAYLYISC